MTDIHQTCATQQVECEPVESLEKQARKAKVDMVAAKICQLMQNCPAEIRKSLKEIA